MRRGAWVLAVVLVVGACTSRSDEESTTLGEAADTAVSSSITVALDAGVPDAVPPDVELQGAEDLICDGVERPCSWADADETVLDASLEIGQAAYDRYAAGESLFDIAADLAADPRMAALIVDEQSLVFRLDGGLATWVVADSVVGGTRGGPPPQPTGATVRRPIVRADIVGTDPESKRALVLAPYQYEFAEDDESAEVAALYEGARGYEGNVTYLANTDEEVQVLSDAFLGWGAYDVIHISTHGIQTCDGTTCATGIYAGFKIDSKEILLDEAGGMTVSFSQAGGQAIIGDNWFRHIYEDGLPDTVVVLSSCQSALGEGLTTALGPGAVFGWTEVVGAEYARPAALALHRSLIEYGTTTARAMDDVVDAGLDYAPTTLEAPEDPGEAWVMGSDGTLYKVTEAGPGGEAGSGGGDGPVIEGLDPPPLPDLELTSRFVRRAPADGDLRVREVAWIDNPQGSGPLTDGATLRARVADDGDYLPVKLRVEGIDPGDEDDTMLRLEVDGVNAGSWPLSEGSATGRWGEWVVEDEVRLLQRIQDDDEVDLRLVVDLPEGGNSEHKVDQVRLECLVGEWRLRADDYAKALFEAAGGAEGIEVSTESGEYRVVVRADGTYTGFRDMWTLRLSTSEGTVYMTIDSEDPGTWQTQGNMLTISESGSTANVTVEVEVDGERVGVGGAAPVSVDAISGTSRFECRPDTMTSTYEGITATFDRIGP